ncbi:MAG: BatD family protein [Legionellaceae bacterium]|nr:BatD family protein [Legionellaceae bacterium]
MQPTNPIIVGISLIICLLCSTAWAAVSVQVTPSEVRLGDTIRYTLTIDHSLSGAAPELQPLDEDFVIVGTERSVRYVMINGNAESQQQWTLLLQAKKTGILTIPAIHVGQEVSEKAQVKVLEADAATTRPSHASTSDAANVFFETEITPAEPYVRQQMIYTVRLYAAHPLLDAEYQEPKVNDAIFVPVGDAHTYQKEYHGHLYGVEEQHYFVYPQHSGHLKIQAPTLRALVEEGIMPRRVHTAALAREVQVLPVPDGYASTSWLPAEDLHLEAHFVPSLPTGIQQGSTLVRKITIQVKGIPAQLFPTLSLQGKGYSVYLSKPTEKNMIKEGALWGESTIEATYVLDKSGDITLPALTVPWYNVNTKQAEVVTLPAQHLQVIPHVAQTATSSAARTTSAPLSMPVAAKIKDKIKPLPASMKWSADVRISALWIYLGFGGLLVVLIGLIGRYSWRIKKRSSSKRSYNRDLRRACETGNAAAARNALLCWARHRWPGASTPDIADIRKRVSDPQLKKELHYLSDVLYAKQHTLQWQGMGLWKAWLASERHSPQKKPRKKSTKLPPMYPE